MPAFCLKAGNLEQHPRCLPACTTETCLCNVACGFFDFSLLRPPQMRSQNCSGGSPKLRSRFFGCGWSFRGGIEGEAPLQRQTPSHPMLALTFGFGFLGFLKNYPVLKFLSLGDISKIVLQIAQIHLLCKSFVEQIDFFVSLDVWSHLMFCFRLH